MDAGSENIQPSIDFEQRKYARSGVTLPGRLFVPADLSEMECDVVDVSAGGAGILCAEPPALDTFVVLYLDGFGRFEAVTARFLNGVLGLRFLCSERKRERIVEKLTAFLHDGVAGITRLRKYDRIPTAPALCVLRPSGQEMKCEVLDISLQGLSLKTQVRPPINELLRLGRSYGRVVRHHEHGIGVEFVCSDFTAKTL